jgi:hypothetical protein
MIYSRRERRAKAHLLSFRDAPPNETKVLKGRRKRSGDHFDEMFGAAFAASRDV